MAEEKHRGACGACGCEVTEGHLLCADHWKAVPYRLREEWYRQDYKAQQGSGDTRKQLEAAKQAILTAARERT